MKKSMKIKLKKKRLIKTLRKIKQNLQKKKKKFTYLYKQFLNKKLIFKIKKLNSKLTKQLIIS